MSPLNTLIFGLGLFFLGLRLIGESLRRLSGPAFRSVIKRTTHSPLLGAGLGVAAGALMQSATAVTFILVSMASGALIKPRAAAPIIIWSNVGLTSLAFIATLNIHPLVAFVIGGAGIALGTIRIPSWQAVAGALLGMGLILFGLEQMGAGAAPLKDAQWFREGIALAVSSPPLAFLAGIAAAAILQSNTGAVMLVITFAANGIIGFDAAVLMIYGTNLGAIGLRIVLSQGLARMPLRMVRFEDLFCIVSAILMLGLHALEAAGAPLVIAFADALPGGITIRLAAVFLLSNLLPALIMTPGIGPSFRLLERFWPDRAGGDDPGQPVFLQPQALNDPSSALDLLSKELARLLAAVRIAPTGGEDAPPPDFCRLSAAIESFAAKLAARGGLSQPLANRLHLLRAELSIIRHIEEGVRYFSHAMDRSAAPHALGDELTALLGLAATAASDLDGRAIRELEARTKLKGPEMTKLQAASANSTLDATALFEDFTIAAWTIHRLAKLLARMPD